MIETQGPESVQLARTSNRTNPSTGRRSGGPGWPRFAVGAAVIAGVLLRIWVLSTPIGVTDSDEAIIGLMARHILEGEFTAFYWGQAYGGSLAAMITALSFALLGSSTAVLKGIPFLLSAVAAILLWRIGRRTVGELAGRLAAATFWVWPGVVVWWSTRWSTYWVNEVIALAAFLVIIRVGQRSDPGIWGIWELALLGFLAGLGWWSNPQVMFLVLPGLMWLVYRWRGALSLHLKRSLVAVPTALAGASPWIAYNFRNGWISLTSSAQPPGVGYLDHLAGFFTAGLPLNLGLRRPYSLEWIHPTFGLLLYIVCAAALAFWLIRGRGGPVLVAMVTYPFVFALSPFSWWVADGRYLLLFAPFVALAIGAGLSVARRLMPPIVAAAIIGLVVISGWSLDKMNREALTAPYVSNLRVPPDFKPLVEELERMGVTRVFADYWIAYRLTFEASEKVVAAPITGADRYPPYTKAVRSHDAPSYVLVNRSDALTQLRDSLVRLDASWQEVVSGDFVIVQPERRILPEQTGV